MHKPDPLTHNTQLAFQDTALQDDEQSRHYGLALKTIQVHFSFSVIIRNVALWLSHDCHEKYMNFLI